MALEPNKKTNLTKVEKHLERALSRLWDAYPGAQGDEYETMYQKLRAVLNQVRTMLYGSIYNQ